MNEKDLKETIATFVQAAEAHTAATKEGDYKTANANYDLIMAAIALLRMEGKIESLLALCDHPNIGVRVWVASHLLGVRQAEAIAVLEEVALLDGIIAFNAKMTLKEWHAGNLKR